MVTSNGSSGAAVWSSGSPTVLPSGVAPGSSAYAIDDSGRVAGWAWFNYAKPSWDLNPDDPSSYPEEHACVWTNAAAYPTDLDTQQNSVNAHNEAYTSNDGYLYSFYQSAATALNTNGIYGYCGSYYFNSVASEFAAGSDPVPADATLNNLNSLSTGPTTGIGAAAGTNYCGGCNRTYGTDPLHGNRDIVTNSAIVSGVEFQPDAGYTYFYLQGINAGGLATGYEASDYTTNCPVLWQNGTNAILPGTGMPRALNNLYTTNVTAGSPPTTNVAATPQIVGVDGTYTNATLWDQVALNGTNTVNGTYVQKNLNWLTYGVPPLNLHIWNLVSVVAINNSGAIVGTATNLFDGLTHGVLLLPCQFRLLNGDTNTADVDGMFFDGTRPTTISATASYNPTNIVSSDIGTTNTDGPGNYGMDVLGVDLPLGQGRANLSGPPPVTLVGQCLIDSLMMVAKVSSPAATNITYGWNRVYQGGEVSIAQTTTNTWYVKADGTPTGVPTPEEDIDNGTPPYVYHTTVPSTNNNVLSCYDNPGTVISNYTNAAPHINDFGYRKLAFTYSLTNSIGSASAVATQQIGVIMVIKRIATSGTISTDWAIQSNVVSTTNVPSPYFTTNEIRAIVAPSTNAIIFDPSVLVSP
jgi:hypothetical protein